MNEAKAWARLGVTFHKQPPSVELGSSRSLPLKCQFGSLFKGPQVASRTVCASSLISPNVKNMLTSFFGRLRMAGFGRSLQRGAYLEIRTRRTSKPIALRMPEYDVLEALAGGPHAGLVGVNSAATNTISDC